MRTILAVFLVAPFLLAASAIAQTKSQDDVMRQDWLLCQAGDIERCNRVLKLPLDDEIRALVEVDLRQARDRQNAQVRVLLDLCRDRSEVRACDRALRYNLAETERAEILEIRKAVIHRAPQQGTLTTGSR
jgi:hypothetical protein